MMNSRIWLVLFLAFCLGLLSGCALFKGGSLSPDRPGYEEGRVAAFAYVGSKPALPDRIDDALRASYALLKGFVETDPADAIVKAEIETLYKDATPEFRAMVFNAYAMLRTRLDGLVSKKIDIPTPMIVANFVTGVEAGLKDWQPKE